MGQVQRVGLDNHNLLFIGALISPKHTPPNTKTQPNASQGFLNLKPNKENNSISLALLPAIGIKFSFCQAKYLNYAPLEFVLHAK